MLCCVISCIRVEEYIASGRDKIIVDPDPNKIYTKRKARECSISLPGSSSHTKEVTEINYPTTGWGRNLEKLPLFTKAEMKKHVENSGKRVGSVEHHSVPTSLKRAKTFLQDEYLKDIEANDDENYFYFKCKCYHSYKKHEAPHTIQVALCIISAQVMHATCTCAAGKVGYCNHTLALMLKICKYSLYESKTTEDLNDELDENPPLACTSTLQTWHKRGRGDSIHPQPVMDLVVTKIKSDDDKQSGKPISCQLYEARKLTKNDLTEEDRFKNEIAAINPKMGIATLASNTPNSMVQTKFGSSPIGSTNSYQMSYTESNFPVYVNISAVSRCPDPNFDINSYPRFPLKDTTTRVYPDTLSSEERTFLSSLEVDEDTLNKIEAETREQVSSERWREERKFRFTASRFHLISRRQRNHNTFAKEMMHPKEFTSRHTAHGRKYEKTAIHEYQKFMNARKTPVAVLKCGLVISKDMPIFAATPDGKVIDFGCSQPFGILEVKCPSTKSAVTPLDACADPKFFCERVGDQCWLKTDHEYYAQVQGQMAISGAAWCDFVVYTFKGMSIQRIPFDQQFWDNISDSLQAYYFQHFITFAVSEFKAQQNNAPTLTRL